MFHHTYTHTYIKHPLILHKNNNESHKHWVIFQIVFRTLHKNTLKWRKNSTDGEFSGIVVQCCFWLSIFVVFFFLNVFVVVGRNDILQFRGTRVKFSSPFTLVSFFNATMGITFIRSDSCCFALYGWKLKRKKYKISRTKQHMKCCSMLTWQDLILNRRCPCWMPTFCRDFPYHNRMANIMRLLSHWQTIPNN